ncbi:D-alanyl-D-alanine carboxypeptidase [Brachybacterium phenoliresistens]|uniref:D-alanyl-D-alanine carboxypeptidase n=1 Tax=Brachybacterium phenoliresistens TaxID=396014 RepID=Z9JS31_9MICO|nr:D-alanyl-D-alanine carboxypeptidase [Brachybacterium phenoliresistens]EWS80606.1 D-alanyl-D-alanine carboxypeptidase [Brachybacterium phenoliresistens]
MRQLNVWRPLAVIMCAAVPIGFYAIGDVTDAFPGILTLEQEEQGPQAGPPAQAEDLSREDPVQMVPSAAPGVDAAAGPELAARMDAHAELPVVQGNLAYAVVDAETGTTLAARDADTARVPASTQKLLTAAALLRVRSGDDTLATRARLGEGTLTLIGEGDMFLTEERLAALADESAAMIAQEGGGPVRVVLDDSFIVDGMNPAWGGNGPAGGWVAPVAALALDEGKLDGEQYGAKSTDPAADAAARFAQLLRDRGVEVTGEVARGAAPETGPEVEIRSAPLREIVQYVLTISDNTGAELLSYLVADARGEETTASGASGAVEAEVRDLAAELGLPASDLESLDLHDGSGLSVDNRVPPRLFAAVLGEVASGGAPTLEPLLYDVPVSGLSGTLAERFGEDDASAARGIVRGKTGYLSGTATLAGVATRPDGRTVSYMIVVHGFDRADAIEAREAVDTVAAEIVTSR